VPPRRFSPPWTVEETAPCFIVRDHNGQALAFVYCEDDPGRRDAAKLLARAGAEAKIGFKVHPHMLQHACAYTLANKGINTRTLQACLGHHSINSTTRYAALAPGRFKNICERLMGPGEASAGAGALASRYAYRKR
jgi:site-specific recombinase XerD